MTTEAEGGGLRPQAWDARSQRETCLGSPGPQVPGGAAGLWDPSLQAPLTCFPATDKPSFFCAPPFAFLQVEGLEQRCVVRCWLALLRKEVLFFSLRHLHCFFQATRSRTPTSVQCQHILDTHWETRNLM